MVLPSCLALEVSEPGLLPRVLGHAAIGARSAGRQHWAGLHTAQHRAPIARQWSPVAPPSHISAGSLFRSQTRSIATPRQNIAVAGSWKAKKAFSTTRNAMAAKKIDGKEIAAKIRERLGSEIVEKKNGNPRYQPCLKIVQGECA